MTLPSALEVSERIFESTEVGYETSHASLRNIMNVSEDSGKRSLSTFNRRHPYS